MCYCPLCIPALNPIFREGEISLLPESAREALSPGLVQGCVSIGIILCARLGQSLPGSLSFVCSKGYEIRVWGFLTLIHHLARVLIQEWFPASGWGPSRGSGFYPLLCSCLAVPSGLIYLFFLLRVSSALKDDVLLILKTKMKQNPHLSNLPKQKKKKKKCLLKRGNYFLWGVKTNKKAPNIPRVLGVAVNRWPHFVRLANISPSPPSKQNVELVPWNSRASHRIERHFHILPRVAA